MLSIFKVFQHGLQKTKTALVRSIQAVFDANRKPWTENTYVELEAALIQADLGVAAAAHVVATIRDRYARGQIATSEDIFSVAREDIVALLREKATKPFGLVPVPPTVVLLVGVNGSGKTTTAAKLAHQWKQDGRTVLLAACDTFRAAAVEQLKIWGDRVGCPVVAAQTGADAAAVAFDAATAARQRGMDILLIDTAGRQHTRKTLMDELGKIARTVGKACPGAPHEVWLTVDASIGTNAVTQAREFGRLVPLTGLVLTKLDGTGKGGSVVAIRQELGYPVHFVGLGEQLVDLQPFDPEMFAKALFGG